MTVVMSNKPLAEFGALAQGGEDVVHQPERAFGHFGERRPLVP